MIMDFITNILIIIFTIITFLIFIICVPTGFIAAVNLTNYFLDESYCTLFIDNKQVYEGRCHYVDINSIGENGNTKQVVIYKDAFLFKPIKKFVSDNVVLKEVQ